MTHATYDARADSLLNSAVQIELQRWRVSRILPCNRPLQAYIHWSPPSIEDDLQCKVAQITNKHTFIFGADHNLEQWGVQRLCSRPGGMNWKARYFNLRDSWKSRYSNAECELLNIDSTAKRKIIRSVRHCMHICEVEYKDRLQRLTTWISIYEQHNADYCCAAFGALMHCGRSIVGGGCDIISTSFAHTGCRLVHCGSSLLHSG